MKRTLTALATALLVCSCTHADEAKWAEEIKLHDGRIITIDRRATRGASDFPNPGRGALGDNEFSYRPLGVRWHNAPRTAGWILAFDVFDGVPYLVVHGAGWEFCKRLGPKSYNAEFLQWKQGQWVRVAQAKFPLQRMTQNVSMNYWGRTSAEDAHGLMSWEWKINNERYLDGEVESLVAYLDRKHMTCGQELPHLFTAGNVSKQ